MRHSRFILSDIRSWGGIILLLCLLYYTPAFPQNYHIKHYSVQEGLPQSQVFAVYQDSKGYLWVGTNGGGVGRFDGMHFQQFTEKDGLVNNVVYDITEDEQGNLWFATSNGISLFTGQHFSHYTKKDGLSGNSVYTLHKDHQGNIWVGTLNNGITKIKVKEDGKLDFKKLTTSEGLINDKVYDILEDKSHDVWICTNGGISRWDGKKCKNYSTDDGLLHESVYTGTLGETGNLWFGTGWGISRFDGDTFRNYTPEDGLENKVVWSSLKDQYGKLWFGTYGGGISKFLPPEQRKSSEKKFINITNEHGLSHNNVEVLYEDREGNIWIGTSGGGLNQFLGEAFITYDKTDGLNNNIVLSILEDNQHNLWFGTYGGGVSKFDGRVMTTYTTKDGLRDNTVWDIIQDQQNNYWFGTSLGISKLKNKQFEGYTEVKDNIPANRIWNILQSTDGMIWFGTRKGLARFYQGKFTSYTVEDGLNSSRVRCIYEAADGNLWIGTDKGINIYNGKNFISFSGVDSIKNYRVFSITQDQDGNMWFGTYGNGIIKYSNNEVPAGQSKFEVFTVDDGLSNNSVVFITFDKKGNLWIGTNKGLNKFYVKTYENTGEKKFKQYTEGFIGTECNPNAVYETEKGKIWFGTIEGAVKYDPEAEHINKKAPLTHITDLKLFHEDLSGLKYADSLHPTTHLPVGLALPYNKNYLTFTFNGISLTAPEKVRYQYRLKGFEKTWSPVGQQRIAKYTNIPPGDYVFQVKACNNDGYWNKTPTTFAFTITPPFWQTSWFYGLCILLGVGSIYTFIKIRTRNIEKARKELEQKVQERTHLLQKAYDEIEEKNKDITSSIEYAKRIQQAILPQKNKIFKAFPQSFIFYQPRELVSGDFYWYHKNAKKHFVACMDCTGHGVPGAFMSMIGNNLLNQVVKEKKINEPGKILKELDEGVTTALQQRGKEIKAQDGMDIAICVIDSKKERINFAGAARPLYFVREGELKEIKGNLYPIGGEFQEEKAFKTHLIKLKKDDVIYMSSDGYADQFGGPRDKKYMKKNFKQLLVDIYHKPAQEQKEILFQEFKHWKGKRDQLDDILVMGIKF